MSRNIEYLLKDICVDLGFCIPPNDQLEIMSADSWNADDFACQILKAEGMNPEYEKQWRREIREKFIKTLGSETFPWEI